MQFLIFKASFYGVTYNYITHQNSKYFPIKTEINNRFLSGNRDKEQRYSIDLNGYTILRSMKEVFEFGEINLH
jgi:hypothetical protein